MVTPAERRQTLPGLAAAAPVTVAFGRVRSSSGGGDDDRAGDAAESFVFRSPTASPANTWRTCQPPSSPKPQLIDAVLGLFTGNDRTRTLGMLSDGFVLEVSGSLPCGGSCRGALEFDRLFQRIYDEYFGSFWTDIDRVLDTGDHIVAPISITAHGKMPGVSISIENRRPRKVDSIFEPISGTVTGMSSKTEPASSFGPGWRDDAPRVCPIADALNIVGDRYALLVLRELAFGVRRFTDIHNATGAPRETLAARIRKLEETGVIARRRYSERPPRDEYVLSEAGEAIVPVLVALREWGERFAQPTTMPD
jgi:DNA-binding HxlR family transcriptional regulator